MVRQVKPQDFADWLKESGTSGAPVVLDVREPQELAIASLKPDGFTLATIPMHTIPARLHELNRDQPIACLCHHGGRSMQVAMYLHRQGFDNICNIAGGIHAWSTEVDPTIPRY